ncbi:LTA synthase family protein [Acidovorax sp. sif1233]|uniref:LTA synthase family protein n=1 Tax=Acidovorax sp. sif1233 TaxID=2854792 RepID=UPI001C48A93C|nr:LTA synthase family protein [Acidovorax sp. sif1233]
MSKRSTLFWSLILALACTGLMFVRLSHIRHAIVLATDCRHCGWSWEAPAYDAGVFGLLVLLLGFAGVLPRWARPLKAAVGGVILLLYSTDVFVADLLNIRLDITDIIKYADDVELNKTVALPHFASPSGAALFTLTLAGCLAFWVLALRMRHGAKHLGVFTVAALGLLAARTLPATTPYAAGQVYTDYITNNLPSGIDTPYTPQKRAELERQAPPAQTCAKPRHAPRPVILLVVESLSLYHSKKFSGIEDYTPELDTIASKYGHLESFYANGFSTDGGLIALLTGYAPIPNINRYHSIDIYQGYDSPKQDMLGPLQAAGIPTSYFSTSDLGFIGMGDWLKKLQFSYIEGPEHPFYNSMPRGSFNDPGDEALYQRYLQWFDHERAPGPFFSVIQTITTHPPFVIPGSSQHGEEAAVRYADRALGHFVRQLEKRGFLDQGILIIMGDHRSMTIQRPGEARTIGPAAHARVPAVIAGVGYRGIGSIAGQWQQADLVPSVLSTLGMRSCTSDFQGRFVEPRQQPRYIFHAQGMERDRVLIKVKDEPDLLFVQLDGDRTHWVRPPDPPTAHHGVIAEINRQRARVPPAEANLAAGFLRWKGLMP